MSRAFCAVLFQGNSWAELKLPTHCFHCFPAICHEVMRPDAMIIVFCMLSFKPMFLLSSFTYIKRLFSSSFSAIRMVSSAYLRLLIFLLPILIPACASSGPAFLVIYSAAAAAAKSLQLCLTLCDPIDGSPPGSPIPGIFQARTLEWVAFSFSRGSSRPRD